jgi:hypothetical protein
VKQLAFSDSHANRATYSLLVPDSMTRWRISALRDFLEQGTEQSRDAGYLAVPVDACRHETFRHLVLHPAATLNNPVTFVQDGKTLGDEDAIRLTGRLTVVTLGREPGPPQTDPDALDVTERNRAAFAACRTELLPVMDRVIDFNGVVIMDRDGSRVASLDKLIPCAAERLDPDNQLRLMHRIASAVHAAPFENISRILDGLEVRPGYEMWDTMGRGFGGVCVEKTSALKFACDILGIPSSPVLGAVEMAHDIEALVERYVRSGGEEPLPVWIQHHLLEMNVAGNSYLVDATNGNIPFHFLDAADTERVLKAGIRSRMVYHVERMQLMRAGNRTGDALLTLSEYHVPDLQMQYIFEQGLGLHISDRAFVGVYHDWGGSRSQLQQNYYTRLALRLGYPPPRFLHEANFRSIADEFLRSLLEKTLEALRERYRDPAYTGDFTFVLQPLNATFWKRPRISRSVRETLRNESV